MGWLFFVPEDTCSEGLFSQALLRTRDRAKETTPAKRRLAEVGQRPSGEATAAESADQLELRT